MRSILSTITNDGLKDSATEEEIVNIVKKEIKKRKRLSSYMKVIIEKMIKIDK